MEHTFKASVFAEGWAKAIHVRLKLVTRMWLSFTGVIYNRRPN